MAGNWVWAERKYAQGVPLIRFETSGPDVVGSARVYMNLEAARGFWEVLGEEIALAEAGK